MVALTSPQTCLDPPADPHLTAHMLRFRETRAAGDFEALYRAARGSVLAWVLQVAGREARQLDPFDLVQDTFVNIFRYADGFRADDDASFRRWARTIAGNVVRRALRTRRAGVPTQRLDVTAHTEPSDPRPGPVDRLSQRERDAELQRAYALLLAVHAAALAELALRDRAALQLIEVEGLSYRDAAARLGLGLSNTKMVVFRARQRLGQRVAAALAPLAVAV